MNGNEIAEVPHVQEQLQVANVEFLNDRIEAVYARGRAELLTIYEHEINVAIQHNAVQDILKENLKLQQNVLILSNAISKLWNLFDNFYSNNQISEIQNVLRRCINSVQAIRNTFLLEEIREMIGRDQQKVVKLFMEVEQKRRVGFKILANEADDMLNEIGRTLGEIGIDFDPSGFNIEKALISARQKMEGLNLVADKVYIKLRAFPFPQSQQGQFNNGVLRTMDAIASAGTQ